MTSLFFSHLFFFFLPSLQKTIFDNMCIKNNGDTRICQNWFLVLLVSITNMIVFGFATSLPFLLKIIKEESNSDDLTLSVILTFFICVNAFTLLLMLVFNQINWLVESMYMVGISIWTCGVYAIGDYKTVNELYITIGLVLGLGSSLVFWSGFLFVEEITINAFWYEWYRETCLTLSMLLGGLLFAAVVPSYTLDVSSWLGEVGILEYKVLLRFLALCGGITMYACYIFTVALRRGYFIGCFMTKIVPVVTLYKPLKMEMVPLFSVPYFVSTVMASPFLFFVIFQLTANVSDPSARICMLSGLILGRFLPTVFDIYKTDNRFCFFYLLIQIIGFIPLLMLKLDVNANLVVLSFFSGTIVGFIASITIRNISIIQECPAYVSLWVPFGALVGVTSYGWDPSIGLIIVMVCQSLAIVIAFFLYGFSFHLDTRVFKGLVQVHDGVGLARA